MRSRVPRIVAIAAASIGLAASCGGHRVATTTTPTPARALPPGGSLVAVAAVRRLRVYRAPHRERPFLVLSNKTEHGAPATFLVKRTRGDWVLVSLARRPNGSTGWVERSAVRVLIDYYRLKIDLTAHRLTLFSHGKVAERIPVGVGESVTPTPTGVYFVVELLKTPDPGDVYGPFAFGLSAYSTVLTHFGAGGKGEIGLHGTNRPDLVGQNVSHGCIRMSNRDITHLAKILPLGTPVEITR